MSRMSVALGFNLFPCWRDKMCDRGSTAEPVRLVQSTDAFTTTVEFDCYVHYPLCWVKWNHATTPWTTRSIVTLLLYHSAHSQRRIVYRYFEYERTVESCGTSHKRLSSINRISMHVRIDLVSRSWSNVIRYDWAYPHHFIETGFTPSLPWSQQNQSEHWVSPQTFIIFLFEPTQAER